MQGEMAPPTETGYAEMHLGDGVEESWQEEEVFVFVNNLSRNNGISLMIFLHM